MRILHTSDWHIGHQLFHKDREHAFLRFFDWLVETVRAEQVEALLIAGDVFDVSVPSARSRRLFFNAMKAVAETECCRHIVIIGGNHDSPAVLDAPADLMKLLDIHIVGGARASQEEEVVILKNTEGVPELIVCAVPFLHEGDLWRELRREGEGVTIAEREQAIREGMRMHYRAVLEAAERERGGLPMVVMGHLYAEGGVAKQSREKETERSLYCGQLGQVSASIFAPEHLRAPEYVALGHLHVPQTVGHCDQIRYSGSPLPMDFEEALGAKEVCIVDLDAGSAAVRTIEVPCFQKMLRLKGDKTEIMSELKALAGEEAWIQVIYEGDENASAVQAQVSDQVQGTKLELLSFINKPKQTKAQAEIRVDVGQLKAMEASEMFARYMQSKKVNEEMRTAYMRMFSEALAAVEAEASEGQQR